ncbi:DUF4142 domain-containing protein [Xylophilus sp.]|uniref:DUF4142 domain-containing protein n=1 Tax=Xylophilus sp. TaxID=2653893 RepID=UPI0013BDFBE9|nr:DUF4142 domain-containing protein [Xylophilus sp.]KAF1050134.1 MAG: hypothetical protein GAK38_00159 [Xylophilus sp.]
MAILRKHQLAVLAVAALSGAAWAAGALDKGDTKFVENAAKAGQYEVQAGQIAASKASDPAVKAFGETLVKDHTAANDELKQFAASKSVTLPTELTHHQRSEIDKLNKLSGPEFDREFIKQTGVKDHKDTIKDFEKAAKNAKDPDLKAWAAKTAPTLRAHEDQAKGLEDQIKKNKKS